MMDVELPYNAGHGDGFAEIFDWPAQPHSRVIIDGTRLDFVVPTFMIRLRAYVDRLIDGGHDIELHLSGDVANYMSRMHFDHGLPPSCVPGMSSVIEHDRRTALIPITRLHELEDVERFAEQVYPLITDQPREIAVFADTIHMGISELAGNGVEHGGNELGCYVAAQKYTSQYWGKKTVLAIGDVGVGIPTKIRGVLPGLEEDHRAIEKAIEPRVTSTGNSQRGFGFAHVMKEATESLMDMVQLDLRSGCGRLTQTVRSDRDPQVACHPETRRIGTWATLTLSPSNQPSPR